MRVLVVMALLLAGAGCGGEGDYSSLNLVEVTGKVTLDGNPLAGAQVAFSGTDGHTPMGVTNDAGEYRLYYDSNHPGCTPGQKLVRITKGSADEGTDPEGTTDEGAPITEPIPAIYNRQSTLAADVSPTNRNFNFSLLSKP